MKKIGILGGGQLGKMFLQNAHNYPFEYSILDSNIDAPSTYLAHHFTQGKFNDYETVLKFGKNLEVISIEIEHVNLSALETLEKQGKRVIPTSQTLKIIQDKSLQKQFFTHNNIPTSAYYVIENMAELNLKKIQFPFIQKLNKGGYDGKGVQLIQSEKDAIWNQPSVIEQKVEIKKELSVIVVKNGKEIVTYPTVEMVFNTELHLVEELFSPAQISSEIEQNAKNIALNVVEKFNSDGIFAVELFLTQDNTILVNEVAPRVHNSGHHTIEANYSSQFDAMLRVLAQLPLGSTKALETATMLNILGEENHIGNACIKGLDEILALENVYFHWYGKTTTKPGRKMGHVTILGERNTQTLEKIKYINNTLKVISL